MNILNDMKKTLVLIMAMAMLISCVPTCKSSDLWIDEMVNFMRDVEFVK